jgi:hypothetical protein
MLNQLHAAADLAAEHRRDLLAEAEAYRLAHHARRGGAQADRPARRRWSGLLRLVLRRVTGRRCPDRQPAGSASA